MTKNILTAWTTVIVLGLSALCLNVALAHGGADPKHGGVVATAGDLSFELAAQGGNAVIHVEDHGKPMTPTGLKGKLTVLNGAEKSEAELLVVGDRLEAKGIQLGAGAKAVAALVTPAGKAITVRFSVK